MKQILIILTVGLLSFGLGWWINEMSDFANGVITEAKQRDNLKNITYQINNINETLIKNNEQIKKINSLFHWQANHSDTTNYLCELVFQEDCALYWYHGQCAYYYFTNQTSDSTIDLLWTYKMDCILNLDFLEKSNGVKKSPKHGDTFATYTLTNDTTLLAKYYFPEWTKKINQITNDSIFPTYFHTIE